jgi:hypothetical protein
MTDPRLEEYKALRATIRQRGTMRAWVFWAGIAIWAALVLATTLVVSLPWLAVIPLLLLAATFEVVFGLHITVERIGRYLDVFHEDQWERTAMVFGAPHPGAAVDPLFTVLFGLATLCNFVPVMLAGAVTVELAAIGAFHMLFVVRLAVARHVAARQREVELARFRQIMDEQATALGRGQR